MKAHNTILAACAFALASLAALAASPGRFFYAGPTGAEGEVLAMKWRFGFHFDVQPAPGDKVGFSCEGIPESVVTVTGADLKFDAQGGTFVESAAVAVSKPTTPWLYDGATTHTTCRAVVTSADGKSLEEKAPVTFAPPTKAMLLMQLNEAFEYNKKLPTNK